MPFCTRLRKLVALAAVTALFTPLTGCNPFQAKFAGAALRRRLLRIRTSHSGWTRLTFVFACLVVEAARLARGAD